MTEIDPTVAADLAKLALSLSHNKKTRKAFGKLVREALPESPHAAAFSDIDVDDRFEKFQADQEAKDLERQKSEMLASMNRQRTKMLNGGPDGTGRKYAEDDVKKIEELMQRKGISDYDDGATLYAATLPPVDPRPGVDIPEVSGATWEIPEFAKFGKDPVRASREVAHEHITQLMRNRR